MLEGLQNNHPAPFAKDRTPGLGAEWATGAVRIVVIFARGPSQKTLPEHNDRVDLGLTAASQCKVCAAPLDNLNGLADGDLAAGLAAGNAVAWSLNVMNDPDVAG